jgi:Flp pilus assembly CpaF family ATPase
MQPTSPAALNGSAHPPSSLAPAPGRGEAWKFGGVDWGVVRQLREEVSERLATWSRGPGTAARDDSRRVYARSAVTEVVDAYLLERARVDGGYSPQRQQQLSEAVYAAVIGLGRLQPLVDDPGIENIEINGCDHVDLIYADGRVEDGPPIADSDEDLISDLQYIASRAGRTLSPARPRLHLTLPGGGRLVAMIETSARPIVVVRLHRVVDTTLQELVERGTLSSTLAQFLHAAVIANANVVITGPPGVGKTTLMRGLASSIPPLERYATLESERELHLDVAGRHRRMVSFEAREGSPELSADGRPAGLVTLSDLIEDCLRGNFSRLIVGEVRGAEVIAMLEAVSTGGKGSLCTIHSNSAGDAFERIVSLCLTRAGTSEAWAYRIAAQSIHFVVHVDMIDSAVHGPAAARRRFVTEVLEVDGVNEFGRPVTTQVFAPTGPEGRAMPTGHMPQRIGHLEAAGFHRGWLLAREHTGWITDQSDAGGAP